MGTAPSPLTSTSVPHIHLSAETCPVCERPIPHEERARIEAKDRARNAEITSRLQEQFARQKTQDEAKAKAEFDRLKRESDAAIEALKKESATKQAEAVEQEKRASEARYAAKITETESARTEAERQTAEFKSELENLRKVSAETIDEIKTHFAYKEAAAREEARATAMADVAEKVAQAEIAKNQAVEAQAAIKQELEQVRRENAAAIEKAQNDASAKEEALLTAAQEQLKTAKSEHESILTERLAEQRESLEKAGLKTLQDERASWFNEKQKLEEKLQDVTRQLQNKNSDELGEGAELDLFELLKAEFPEDKITRFAKGEPGADTLHEIYQNGKLCGRIIYESKNSLRFSQNYIAKLRQDQLAANADQAILSTHKLPGSAKQVHVQDSVIVCHPGRVTALAHIVRRHIVQMHCQRHSNEERASKTEALYEFVTSSKCDQFLDDIKAYSKTLEDIDVNELKAHQKTWKQRGEVIRKIQRSQGELRSAIDRIIGTKTDLGDEEFPEADVL
jgi:hypothetical protein